MPNRRAAATVVTAGQKFEYDDCACAEWPVAADQDVKYALGVIGSYTANSLTEYATLKLKGIPRVRRQGSIPKPTIDVPMARWRERSLWVGGGTVGLDEKTGAPALTRNTVSQASSAVAAHAPSAFFWIVP